MDQKTKLWIIYFDSLPKITRKYYDGCCNCYKCEGIRKGFRSTTKPVIVLSRGELIKERYGL